MAVTAAQLWHTRSLPDMPKLYTQEEVDKLLAEKLDSVRTKDLTDEEMWDVVWENEFSSKIDFARAVIAADREKNK